MLRRLATLSVLLLSLAGAIPTAMACVFMTQTPDCCPSGQLCEPKPAPTLVASIGSPCCYAQSAPTRATVVIQGQSERRFADSPAPDHAAAPAFEFSTAVFSLPERAALAVPPPITISQQQLYLRTGRLRL